MSEAKVYLVQLLCPKRHCIIAAAYEAPADTFEGVVKKLEQRRAALGLNPWCGLCGSTVLRYELGKTKFESMEQALPLLLEAEQANLATREAMRQAGLSYDHLKNQ